MENKRPVNFIDKTGIRFGKLVAIEYLGHKKWKCKCDCGNETIVNSDHLSMPGSNKRGTNSCGCTRNSRLTSNSDFFKEINSEEKAYILGFLAADGTISYNSNTGNYSIKIVVQKQDEDILFKIKNVVGSKTTIKESSRASKLPQGGFCNSITSSLLLCNKTMTEDLIQLGVTPNKSLTLSVRYDKIPDNMKRHFWRGLIEGDGSFGIYGKKQILSLCLTTSLNMCVSTKNEILKQFPEFKISYYHAIGCADETMRFMFTSQNDVYEFLCYLYNDSSIYLDRKFLNFLTIKENFLSKYHQYKL